MVERIQCTYIRQGKSYPSIMGVDLGGRGAGLIKIWSGRHTNIDKFSLGMSICAYDSAIITFFTNARMRSMTETGPGYSSALRLRPQNFAMDRRKPVQESSVLIYCGPIYIYIYIPCVTKKTVVPNFGDNFVKS